MIKADRVLSTPPTNTPIEFEDAVSLAQRMEVTEGDSHPAIDPGDRYPMVEKYRAALVRQLLTPAWDANSIKWKQVTFAKGQHKHTDVDPKRIERAIADDLAWIAAHPTRRSNSEAMARSREFKEAMRQRIRDINYEVVSCSAADPFPTSLKRTSQPRKPSWKRYSPS